MTLEEHEKNVKRLIELREKLKKGEIKHNWTPEQRKAWADKCNA